jgi:O-antigen/teichoic acid export membrane protein
MQKRQILINTITLVSQVLVTGGILFFLYRFLINTIGVEQLGIWSVVLASTSVTNIANLGLSSSVVKFVAKYSAQNKNEKVSGVIQTAAISVGVLVGFFLLFVYPFANWLLSLVVPLSGLKAALSILPYALVSYWIILIAGVFQAGLDGCQRIELRSMIFMAGALLHLIFAFIFVPIYGLMGLAYARVIQTVIVLICSWLIAKRIILILPAFPYRWSRNLFREIIGYGINYQVISISYMLWDPTTKALLTKFGDLTMVGFYEMASRMVVQLRAFIVSASQVLVPAIADLEEKNPEKIQSVYLTSYQLIFYLALPLCSLIILCTPVISILWIGHYEGIFITFSILLAIGWFLNTLSVPAYYSGLGSGKLLWNVISYISIGTMNAVLGIFLGMYHGGMGVVIAWVVSLAIGSSIIYLFYHINNDIPLMELIPKTSKMLVVTCIVCILISRIMFNKFDYIINPFVSNGIITFAIFIILLIHLWFHPMRKRLIGWITTELLKSPEPGKK